VSAAEKDRADRAAIENVGVAIARLNDALRDAMALKIRVEFGVVYPDASRQKVAQEWRQLWSEDGLAARFTREEIFTAPAPTPPPVDGAPNIGGGA
jgi:hypothetical protein